MWAVESIWPRGISNLSRRLLSGLSDDHFLILCQRIYKRARKRGSGRRPVINVILFGQYKKLMAATLARLARLQSAPNTTNRRVLQLTCVYGELTPKLVATVAPAPLHITDGFLPGHGIPGRRPRVMSALL